MLQKASRASHALRSMIDSTIAAMFVNNLLSNSLSPFSFTRWSSGSLISTLARSTNLVLLIPSWLHPPNSPWRTPGRNLSTLITISMSPPLFWQSVLSSAFIRPLLQGISHLAKYMSYITREEAPPLVRKAVLTQKVIAAKTKYNWWSNSWHILDKFQVQESNPSDIPSKCLKDEIRSQYRCWWLQHLAVPSNSPKFHTFQLFKTSFANSPLSQHWSILPPPSSLAFPLFQPPSRHRARSTSQHPPGGSLLSVL